VDASVEGKKLRKLFSHTNGKPLLSRQVFDSSTAVIFTSREVREAEVLVFLAETQYLSYVA